MASSALEGDLDTEQLTLFDLAFSAAELAACEVLLERLEGQGAGGGRTPVSSCQFFCCAKPCTTSAIVCPPDQGTTGCRCKIYDIGADDWVGAMLSSRSLESLWACYSAGPGEYSDAQLPDEQRMIRDSFRQFARDRVAPLAERIHREDLTIPTELIDGLRELGCFGLSVPQRFGGLNPDDGDDSLGMVIVTEELSRASLGAAGSLITRPEIVTRALLEGGTPEQQQHWLPGIASGEMLCAVSVTEPAAGSDVAGVRLKRQAHRWRLVAQR